MNKMNLGKPFRGPTSGMYMMPTKVAAKLQSFMDRQVCKVLISEGDYFTLCNQQGKLVFSFGCQLAELNPSNLRAYCWCELLDSGIRRQEIFQGGVGIFSMVDMGKRLQSGVFFAMVPYGKIVGILYNIPRLAISSKDRGCERAYTGCSILSLLVDDSSNLRSIRGLLQIGLYRYNDLRGGCFGNRRCHGAFKRLRSVKTGISLLFFL